MSGGLFAGAPPAGNRKARTPPSSRKNYLLGDLFSHPIVMGYGQLPLFITVPDRSDRESGRA
jgi:hypothetical protein